jgi:hypothetical protein
MPEHVIARVESLLKLEHLSWNWNDSRTKAGQWTVVMGDPEMILLNQNKTLLPLPPSIATLETDNFFKIIY